MKWNLFRLFILVSVWDLYGLGVQLANAQPHDESKYPVSDETVRREIEPPKASSSIDEHLLKLAKAGNVNFIADATSLKNDEPVEAFPASEMAQFNKWVPRFHLTVLDFTQEKKLSTLRFDKNTFLFWAEPKETDIVEAAQRVVKNTPRANEDTNAAVVGLWRYLANEKLLGEAILKTPQVVDIPQDQLTSAQQTRIAQIVKQLISDRNRFQAAWFDDDFWSGAAVRLQSVQGEGKVVQALQVAGFYNKQVVGSTIPGLER